VRLDGWKTDAKPVAVSDYERIVANVELRQVAIFILRTCIHG